MTLITVYLLSNQSSRQSNLGDEESGTFLRFDVERPIVSKSMPRTDKCRTSTH